MMNFHIFGMGTDHLHYIGWTERSLSDEHGILSDLARSPSRDVAGWVEQAHADGAISIFEIESAPTATEARDAVQFWCQYYAMAGARVASDCA